MGPGLVLLAAIGGAALVRALGARRVRRGDRRFVPLTLFATFLLAVLLVVVAVWAAARSLWLGVPLLIGALILGGGWLRVSLDLCRYSGPAGVRRTASTCSSTGLPRAIGPSLAWLLGAGFVLAVAAIVWLLFGGRF